MIENIYVIWICVTSPFHGVSLSDMIESRILKIGGFILSENKRNKITVEIYGQEYSIVGEESSHHIRLVASMVDDKMREINSKNPNLGTSKLAVLTAINTVHDYIKIKEELHQLELEINKEKD
jgi:cell division protein ZapA